MVMGVLDRLTLDQLRALIAIAETGSFSAAARRLGRVQSAITQSVHALESALGISLFDRTGKRAELTEVGRVILDDARRLVVGAATLRARAQNTAAGIEPELTLAVTAAFPDNVLLRSLKALQAAFPELPVTLYTEGLAVPERRLRDGLVRLAIYPLAATGASDLETELLATIPITAVVAPDHPLAAEKPPLSSEVMERYVQLASADRYSLRQDFAANIATLKDWHFGDQSTRLKYLLAGFGWCNLPMHVAKPYIASGALKQLNLAEYGGKILDLALHVVHERGRPPGRAGRWIIDDLRSRLYSHERVPKRPGKWKIPD